MIQVTDSLGCKLYINIDHIVFIRVGKSDIFVQMVTASTSIPNTTDNRIGLRI